MPIPRPSGFGSFEFVEQVLEAEATGNRFPFSVEDCGKVFGRVWRDSVVRLLKENTFLRENIDFAVRPCSEVARMERLYDGLPVEQAYSVDSTKAVTVAGIEFWLTSESFIALCLVFRNQRTLKHRLAYVKTRRWFELGHDPTNVNQEKSSAYQ